MIANHDTRRKAFRCPIFKGALNRKIRPVRPNVVKAVIRSIVNQLKNLWMNLEKTPRYSSSSGSLYIPNLGKKVNAVQNKVSRSSKNER
jgi:hypothetical protein